MFVRRCQLIVGLLFAVALSVSAQYNVKKLMEEEIWLEFKFPEKDESAFDSVKGLAELEEERKKAKPSFQLIKLHAALSFLCAAAVAVSTWLKGPQFLEWMVDEKGIINALGGMPVPKPLRYAATAVGVLLIFFWYVLAVFFYAGYSFFKPAAIVLTVLYLAAGLLLLVSYIRTKSKAKKAISDLDRKIEAKKREIRADPARNEILEYNAVARQLNALWK